MIASSSISFATNLHGCLELHLVDDEQRLSLAYVLALVHTYLGDESAYLRTDVDVGLSFERDGI